MSAFLRDNVWRLGIAFLGVIGLSAAVLVFQNDTSEAFPGMPAEQRAYWEWVSTIGADEAAALASGFTLLESQPDQSKLYGRLAELCGSLEREDDCRTAFGSAAPESPDAALYRDAAVQQLGDELDPDAWKEIAAAPVLEPSLARIVVDEVRQAQQFDLLGEIEASWEDRLAADSSLAGAAFGLGYAAVLRNEWERATPYLEKAAELRPDDSEPYREFGRMYFYTGDYDRFVEAMEQCIANARKAYDIEEEVRNRGNLGLGFLQWKGDLERASEMFEVALEQSERLEMGRGTAIAAYRLANVRGRQHRYDEALELIDRAEAEYEQHAASRISELWTLKGQVLKNVYRLTDAEAFLEKAVASAQEHRVVPNEATALLGLAEVRSQMGRYDQGRAAADSAMAIASRFNVVDLQMNAYAVLGEIERLSGNFDLAIRHFTAGLALAEGTDNSARASEFNRELGVSALQLGNLGDAQRYFDAYDDLVAASDLSRADVHYWIGSTYSAYENYDLAVRHFEEGARLAEGRSDGLLGLIRRNQAVAELELDRVDSALAHYRDAKELLPETGLQSYAVTVALGHALVETGSPAEALEAFHNAERLEDELEWSAIYWYKLYGEALAHWDLGDTDAADEKFIEAVSLIETTRDHLSDPEHRSFFVQDVVDVFDDYASFLRENDRTAEAFHINERGQSRTLLDLLYSTQRSRKLDLSSSVDRAIELARQVGAVEDELNEGISLYGSVDGETDALRGRRAAFLRDARSRAESQYQQTVDHVFGSKRLYTFSPVLADSVSAILADDEVLAVYNLAENERGEDSTDRSSVYLVTSSGIHSFSLDVESDEMAEAIKFFRSAIETPSDDASWRTASRRLYDELVAPVIDRLPSGIEHINFVPEGAMHYMPFAALLDESGAFLVERFSVSVVPSASVLKLAREANPRHWSYMLLLGDPDARLPGARSEVLSIAAEAPSRRHALVGKDASLSMFEDVASRYDVLHFATHAWFDNRAPWRSHLELHNDDLTVAEIGNLDLDAYLVTLSACETALASGLVADIPDGDEWVGFNQAFLAAGTPSVLASLWPIDDDVSSTLMTDFYDRLATSGKAAALSEVQRSAIADERTSHPFYWAAFTVFGDPI